MFLDISDSTLTYLDCVASRICGLAPVPALGAGDPVEPATDASTAGKFWDEIAETGETAQKVVQIFKDYDKVRQKAGGLYTCG